jgi:hypothetical protein
MRSFLLAAALFVTACATSGANRPVNVAAVRSEINGTIRSQQNDRSVTSMGHTEAGKAVVYTTNKSTGERLEETWIKDGSGWKMESSTKLAASGT